MTDEAKMLTIEEATGQGLELMQKLGFCLLGTNGEDGFPYIKAMMNLKHDGLKHIWFSTNTSSNRVRQVKTDNRACVYYVDSEAFKGLMLLGTIEVLQDKDSREMMWFEGSEMFYPLGVNDPDYSVLHFTAARANYYHALRNISFDLA